MRAVFLLDYKDNRLLREIQEAVMQVSTLSFPSLPISSHLFPFFPFSLLPLLCIR